MALRGWSHYELYSYCFSFLVICSLIRILFLFNSHSTWQNKKNEIGKVSCHYESLVLSQPQALRLARNSPTARSICGGYNNTCIQVQVTRNHTLWSPSYIWDATATVKVVIDSPRLIAKIGSLGCREPSPGNLSRVWVVNIIKDDANFFAQWHVYYLCVGAEKILLYNNDSTDHIAETVSPFVEAGLLDYEVVHGRNIIIYCYREALRKAKANGVTWLVQTDNDEYIVLPGYCLHGYLGRWQSRPQVGAVVLNWAFTKADGLWLDDLSSLMSWQVRQFGMLGFQIKSMYRVEATESINHPHFGNFEPGYYAVGLNGEPVRGASHRPTDGPAHMLHFFQYSVELWVRIRIRGKGDMPDDNALRHECPTCGAPLDVVIREYFRTPTIPGIPPQSIKKAKQTRRPLKVGLNRTEAYPFEVVQAIYLDVIKLRCRNLNCRPRWRACAPYSFQNKARDLKR